MCRLSKSLGPSIFGRWASSAIIISHRPVERRVKKPLEGGRASGVGQTPGRPYHRTKSAAQPPRWAVPLARRSVGEEARRTPRPADADRSKSRSQNCGRQSRFSRPPRRAPPTRAGALLRLGELLLAGVRRRPGLRGSSRRWSILRT